MCGVNTVLLYTYHPVFSQTRTVVVLASLNRSGVFKNGLNAGMVLTKTLSLR